MTPTSIEAVFTAPDVNGGRKTMATSLSLGPDAMGTPEGMLRLSEGDAGSMHFTRCTP